MKYQFSDLQWNFLFIISCHKLTYRDINKYNYFKAYYFLGIRIFKVRIGA